MTHNRPIEETRQWRVTDGETHVVALPVIPVDPFKGDGEPCPAIDGEDLERLDTKTRNGRDQHGLHAVDVGVSQPC